VRNSALHRHRTKDYIENLSRFGKLVFLPVSSAGPPLLQRHPVGCGGSRVPRLGEQIALSDHLKSGHRGSPKTGQRKWGPRGKPGSV
jgi:hypothetical protein